VAFVGPSGSGKTSALRAFRQCCPDARDIGRITFPTDRSIVDGVAATGSLSDALALLAACALSEVPLCLRPFRMLSEGEKFRARLARAVGVCARRRPGALVCDEFCTALHRRAALAVAYNVRKLVTRRRLCIVLATSRPDILRDLQPDTTIRLTGNGRHEVIEQAPARGPISFRRRLRIEPGSLADYAQLAAMHYRRTDGLGPIDRIFVARERRNVGRQQGVSAAHQRGVPLGRQHGVPRRSADLEPLAVVVYGHAPLQLALRNRATNRRFSGHPHRLNRELRILRRLVVHPDVRGCGLGHWLVKRTLPLLDKPYVECLASMGRVNPVFERAGMQRIGDCPAPRHLVRALEKLRGLGVDPAASDFVTQIRRRRDVRAVVRASVYRWYCATTTDAAARCSRRESPQALADTFRGVAGLRPVYYLWERKGGNRGQATFLEGTTRGSVQRKKLGDKSRFQKRRKKVA
jgi:energy-coupling factor transporter ATP-binding protein EcfA2